jgi:RHS repeat-associated protein
VSVENATTVAERDVDYTYDDLYRLVEADNTTASEVRTYSYDAIGNILSKSDQGDYAYDETGKTNPQAVTEIEVSSVSYKRFTYDDNGNLTDLEEDIGEDTIVSEFTWDHHNRMLQSAVTDIASVTTTTDYLYSADGTRLKKVVDDGTTTETTLYPFRDYEITTTNSQKISVSAGNTLVAVLETDGTGTEIYYHDSDHLGGSNIVTDDAGALVQEIDYHPFGAVRANNQSASYDSTPKFTGHELDDATGLYYAQARYYDPNVGRFIGQDPLQMRPAELMKKFAMQPQALNYYSYVTNNPLVLVDPEGEETKVYIKSGDWDHGIDSAWGHAFVEISRGGESTFYSWSPSESRDNHDLYITDDKKYVETYRDDNDVLTIFTFETTQEQEKQIDNYYKDLQDANVSWEKSAQFDPFGYNCTDVVVEALQSGGVIGDNFQLFGISTPNELKKNFDRKYENPNVGFKWIQSKVDSIMKISDRDKI